MCTSYNLRAADDDWGQAGTLLRDVMDDAERERLVSNVAGHLRNGRYMSNTYLLPQPYTAVWTCANFGTS